jgi:hypothetical protein
MTNLILPEDPKLCRSSGFKPELFTPYQVESPRIDFKKTIYQFTSDEPDGKKCKEEKEKKKFEFIKDIIAFSNVAWRIGKPCFILFGIEDKRGKIYDVGDQVPHGKPPGWWKSPEITVHQKITDGISKPYKDIIEAWVGPQTPDFSIEFGYVEDKFVSYIEIKRDQSASKPYRLKKQYKKAGINRLGDVFIRKNSSSVLLTPDEAEKLERLKYTEVEYIQENEWQKLLKKHRSGDFKKASETPFKAKLKSDKNQTVETAVLENIEKGCKTTFIIGEAGTGKSVTLYSIAHQLVERHNLSRVTHNKFYGHGGEEDEELAPNYLIKNIVEDLESTPLHPIPVFMSLRKGFADIYIFERALLNQIKVYLEREEFKSFKSIYKIPGIRWVLLLDGLDEIRNREQFGSHLKGWIDDLPDNVQIVLTTRPHGLPSEECDEMFWISPLQQNEIKSLLDIKFESYLEEQKFDDDTDEYKKIVDAKNRIIDLLDRYPGLYDVVDRFRPLDGLISYVTIDDITLLEGDQATLDKVTRQKVSSPDVTSDEEDIDEMIKGYFNVENLPQQVDEDADERDRSFRKRSLRRYRSFRKRSHNLKAKPEHKNRKSSRSFRKRLYGQKDEGFKWIDLENLALCLSSIINFIREKEEKRKEDWGHAREVKMLSEEANIFIDQIAWELSWSKATFNSREWFRRLSVGTNVSVHEVVNWNWDLGFIQKETRLDYSYTSHLLRCTLGAQFAYDWYEDQELEDDIKNKIQPDLDVSPLGLLNLLREANGRPKLNLDCIGG